MAIETKFLSILIFVLPFCFISCNGQEQKKPFANNQDEETTPADHYGIPQHIASQDTSPGWSQHGQKILLTGTVYQQNGKTVAPDVVIYYYHTNVDGRYLHKETESRSLPPNSKGQTHGDIRGWVKTDNNGNYSIYTVRPGTYATRDEPAHVHLTIREPGMQKSYYIDDFVFDDDKLLTSERRKRLENRGGRGVVRMVQKGNLLIGERNIILGLHIPGYPQKLANEVNSGGSIGEDLISFIPFHAWGPDRGTKTCPVCRYGWYHGILYFVGNRPDWVEIRQWLILLEAESKKREKHLKVYFVYGNDSAYSKLDRERGLQKLGKELQLEKVALTFVPSFSDMDSEIYLHKINQEIENTFILYKRSKIIDKYINLKPTQQNFNIISERLNQSINKYFDLSKPLHE